MPDHDGDSPVKAALWGVAFLAGGALMCKAFIGNPMNDLALIRESRVTDATLMETAEFDGEGERGQYYEGVNGAYQFAVNGKDYFALSTQSHSSFDPVAQVQFLERDPSINRMKGDGVQTIGEWLWRKAGLGLILAGIFMTPGIVQLRAAYRAHRQRQGTSI